MKRFFIHASAIVLFTAALMACVNDPDDSDAHHEEALFVVVKDSAGALVAADSVHWSIAGDGHHKRAHGTPNDTVKYGAIRVNDSGSVWKITDHLHGSFHVRAEVSRPYPGDTLCGYTGYAVTPFHADSIADTVTVTMNVSAVCI